ncbi:hypothetical protein ABB37_07527 [Leptomonas pyrrhocoris]|uniref:Uncharacterized protein n=1 Tax=Leptomonas pyrrhocoris TaxID=157538 RepID=A0A0N0VDW0_LEPPY|nr:hypothetical protein ABB37_07527 [Leptomonas pyrrhocoris]KPA76678.1 hypothetical protein ABB37_07527 [Leptomonas pyrrhocoris]|eukprot:XP_015655117.1 hypothetical protein ABB37_07527 [Leptomonas pyrrhocoris]
MPVSVSMHACSVWPMTVDFTVFRFFLQGYSVEETVEQLMALQNVAPEDACAKRRTSSASSSLSSSSTASTATSSSSRLSVHSPDHFSGSGSPGNSPPAAVLARGLPGSRRNSAGHRQDAQRSSPDTSTGAADATSSTSNAFRASESELLREDKRVTLEEEHPEELTLTPGNASPYRPTAPAPVTTAVHTSTNAARPPHSTEPAARSRYTHASGQENSQPEKASQPPLPLPSTPHVHRPRHQHSLRPHNPTHEPPSHHNHHDRRKKKSRHFDATRNSSVQQTTSISATTTAATSFVLPPMWNCDCNATPHNSSLLQHTHHNSGVPSTEDLTTAVDSATAKDNGASYNNNNNATFTVPGGDKNSLSENRRAARRKRHKERQCFFLNEDYVKFQRQLQEVEAVPGVGMGASSLQSRFLFEEVTEQFQTFRELAREEQLGSPYAFLSNYYLPIPIAARLELLQTYYETDPGVFRWAFGDKLTRFDLPGALAAVREAYMSGNLSSPNLNKSLFGTSSGSGNLFGANGGAAAHGRGGSSSGGGGGGSFWSGRWKSSPGKLATMDAATVVRLGEQHTDALRRQWENVKHVCVTVAALYCGKGGMCVPLDMSLLTTIQQCFGLRHEQALDYATAAFGYEHRLETRLFDRLHSFSEYGAVCSIVASVWCDESGYFLSESFRTGCRRVGRLLDEYRLLSELHSCIFGESMRPRWQVQLDEVQRVITTSSLVDKNTVASATAVAGSPVASGTNLAGLSAGANSNNNGSGFAGGRGGANACGGSPSGAIGGGGYNTGLSGGGGVNGNGGGNAGGGDGGGVSPGVTPTNANVHSPFSGNGQYSRRFLMEFPSLMKHLLRVCIALGNNGGVNDALDIFFTRVYCYLEALSTRGAPVIVSMLMNASGPARLAAAGLTSNHDSVGGSGAAAPSAAPGAFGKPPLPPVAERAGSHSDFGHAGARLERGTSTTALPAPWPSDSPSLVRANSAHTIRASAMPPRSMSSPTLSGEMGGEGRQGLAATTMTDTLPPAGATYTSGAEDVLVADAADTVVNTSLYHPARALIPLSAAIAVHNACNAAGSFASSPVTAMPSGRSFGAEDESSEWNAAAAGSVNNSSTNPAAAVVTPRSNNPSFFGPGGNGGGGVGAAHSLLTSQVGDMVRKAIDKRYLRELCMLLTALPKAWRQLTMLNAEDRAMTDKTVSDLAMALKAITQVLMASDDFH